MFKKHKDGSFVENIGHDGSGVHCGENCTFRSSLSMNKNVTYCTMGYASKK